MNLSNNTNQKRAVIYVRVSTTEQADEGNSLKWQEKACREYAEKQSYIIPDGCVFVEAGESAKTTDRTKLQEMLSYCSLKKNAVSAVIVYKIDRLARNTDDYSQLRLVFRRYGASIKSATEHIEDTPVGRFMENTIANVAQFDNDIRSERSSAGMKDAMREGRYVWGAPVGLENTIVGGKSDILPTGKAKFVLQTFEIIASNLYPTDEVWRMMREKLTTKNGTPISKSYFRDLLQNTLLTGWIEKFGEQHRANYGFIVPEELFLQVQRILKNKGHKVGQYKTDNPDFPLRRFVFNPDGIKLTGSFAKGKYPSYRFTGVKGNYNRDDFEIDFMKLMDRYAFNKEKIEKLKRFIKLKFDKSTEGEKREVEKLKKRLIELTAEERALVQKNVKGVLKDAVLTRQLGFIEEEAIKIHSLLASKGNVEVSLEEALEFTEEYLLSPSKVWRKAKLPTQLKLQ
jgi:DNA invertase Pin-like site-specific DNA recombinase